MHLIGQSKHRRHRVYVDPGLQNWLTLALALLEIGLIALMLLLLRDRVGATIDDGLYRVHAVSSAPLFAELLRAAWLLVAGFVVANIIALALAETLWRRHVNAVLREFSALIAATAQLDFSAAGHGTQQHEVLALACAWRAQERARLLALRERSAELERGLASGGDAARARAIVLELRRLLPELAAAEAERSSAHG